ncbi:MAG: alpha/beta fold hydrolase, partial [Verrucomicrobiae bacterium]|nr:alpha/beta fold hydrolase [Verrucomicrobiae bacterium]
SRIQRTLGVTLPLGRLFRAPTIRQLARAIDEEKEAATPPETDASAPGSEPVEPSVHRGGIHLIEDDEIPKETAPSESFVAAPTTVAIQPKGDELPIFAVHGGDGGILFYGNLASRLGEERPFYAFEAPALTAEGPVPEESVETTAARYLSEMRKVRPEGPYILCGYSFGGVVAFEMACQLVRQGGEVALLGLFDTENPAAEARRLSMTERVAANWNDRSRANAGVIEKVGALGKRVGSGLAYRLFFEAEYAVAKALPPAKGSGWLKQVQLRQAHERAMEAYLPPKYPGKLTLFRAIMGHDKFDVGYEYGWDSVVQGGIDVIDIPGNHVSVFHKENIDGVSEAFRKALSGVES